MRVIIFILVCTFSLNASDWKKMHGKYITLEFTEGYESLADSMVNIADQAVPRLAALQGVPLQSFEETKTRIILTDAPDISNGFAIENAVVIYVRASMYMSRTTGGHNWYRRVLEHELVHHITFRAIWRKSNYLGLAFNLSVPRWFFEGTAQYFAETWTSLRGDIYLKRAVLNGQLSYNSLMDLSNGRLLYGSAHAFVRYLADQYGDSSLVKLVNYEKEAFFYNFNKAFKQVYGKTTAEIFQYFLRDMIVYYGNQAAEYPQLNPARRLPEFGYRDFQVIPLRGQDSTYIVSSQLRENHLFTTSYITRTKNGQREIIATISDNHSTLLYISPDQSHIAYGRLNSGIMMNQNSIDFEWFVYNLESGKNTKVADNIRAFKAGFTQDNKLLLVTVEGTLSKIKLYQNDGVFLKDLYQTDLAIDGVSSFEDGSIVFEVQQENAQRDLFMIKEGQVSQLTDDAADNRDPLVLGNRIIFNQMIDKNPAVTIFDLQNKETQVLINAQDPVIAQQVNPDSNQVIVAFRDAGNKLLFAQLSVDSLLLNPIGPQTDDPHPQYESWIHKEARADSIEVSDPAILADKEIKDILFPQGNLIHLQSLPVPVYHQKDGAGLFLISLWVEAMQRQILFVNSYMLFNDWQASYLSLLHYMRLFNLDFTSLYYHGPGILTRINGQYTKLIHDYGEISVGQYSFVDGNPYWPYAIMTSYRIDKFTKKSGILDYSYHGPSVSAGIGYELPSSFQNVFPKRAIRINGSYFKSLHSERDFSTIDLSLMAGTNLFLEKLGLTTHWHWAQNSGNVSPSAFTGIDQDYAYAIPRDFLNTKTIRGIRKNYFGDQLLWNSTELTLLLAQSTSMKILFLPVNELAISAFFDAATVKNSDLKKTTDLYSYGSELSIGFGALRLGAGYAVGNSDGIDLDGEYYGRLTLRISNVLDGFTTEM